MIFKSCKTESLPYSCMTLDPDGIISITPSTWQMRQAADIALRKTGVEGFRVAAGPYLMRPIIKAETIFDISNWISKRSMRRILIQNDADALNLSRLVAAIQSNLMKQCEHFHTFGDQKVVRLNKDIREEIRL